MKIRKVFAAFAALILAVSANAQDTDYNTLVFVDAQGKMIENGSTIVATEIEDGMIPTGLSVKNTTGEQVGVQVEYSISQIDNGNVNCCFPDNCAAGATEPGTYTGLEGYLESSETRNFKTEWIFTGTGKCTATFKLKILSIEFNKWGIPTYSFKADGPSVTVNFVNDPTGIEGVTGDKDGKTVKGYYTVDGQRLAAPQKGINVVKYSDGKSSKIVY